MTFSHSHTDLSLMEERPRRGKTLERHDGPTTHQRCPVARPQGLIAPPQLATPAFSPNAPVPFACPTPRPYAQD